MTLWFPPTEGNFSIWTWSLEEFDSNWQQQQPCSNFGFSDYWWVNQFVFYGFCLWIFSSTVTVITKCFYLLRHFNCVFFPTSDAVNVYRASSQLVLYPSWKRVCGQNLKFISPVKQVNDCQWRQGSERMLHQLWRSGGALTYLMSPKSGTPHSPSQEPWAPSTGELTQ